MSKGTREVWLHLLIGLLGGLVIASALRGLWWHAGWALLNVVCVYKAYWPIGRKPSCQSLLWGAGSLFSCAMMWVK